MNRDAKVLIISPKQKGNTYQVAEAMKANTNADLLILENPSGYVLEDYNHIVLCSGVYGDKINATLFNWLNELKENTLQKGVVFHVFLTWFGRGKSDENAYKEATEILKSKGITCSKSYGSCFGGKWFIKKGHPNGDDFKQAVAWLKDSCTDI